MIRMKDICVSFRSERQEKLFGTSRDQILFDVSLRVPQGTCLGILGESGSGKSTLLKAAMGLLGRDGMVTRGDIFFRGQDIPDLPEKQLRTICGAGIGMIFQDAGASLSPIRTIGAQIRESMAVHKKITKAEAKRQALQLFEKIGLEDGERIWRSYPFELSGGMKQRVLLAQALLGNPKILILDEPTAGLDPKERIAIRNYIAELSKDKIILFATHVVSDIECIADKVLLLKNGEIIATGTPSQLIEQMQGKVGELTCTLDDVASLQEKYHIGNIRQRKDGLVLRLVGDELPKEAVKVDNDIDLEDVYLYYFE